MQRVAQFRHIIFDFDGVLAETNQIRIDGFRTLFGSYPVDTQDSMVSFTRANGGLSRYIKIRFFFEKILFQQVSNDQVKQLAAMYSDIVKKKIIAANAVSGSLEFLTKWMNRLDFAIISGSDELELHSVCKARSIAHFFVNIYGSPATKQENFQRLFDETGWQRRDCLFVGDTKNDLSAADDMGVPFLARASGLEEWRPGEVRVISDLTELEATLFLS